MADSKTSALTERTTTSPTDELPIVPSGGATQRVKVRNLVRETLTYALGDETTAITTGTKLTIRAPFAITLTDVRACLTGAGSSLSEFDVKETGTTIFSTTLTVDASEKTSVTAATPCVLSDTSIADDAELTFIIVTAGTGATGAKITLYGYRT